MKNVIIALSISVAIALEAVAASPKPDDSKNGLWLNYSGSKGPGKGKDIVLIAADQEYRSEQSMPMLAKVLSKHHGFDCTVLFSVNEKAKLTRRCPLHSKTKRNVTIFQVLGFWPKLIV